MKPIEARRLPAVVYAASPRGRQEGKPIMTDTPAHTPLPWTFEAGVEDSEGEFYVCHSGTVCDATTVCNPHNGQDAAFIVRACNSHYQLLKALRDLLDEVAKSPCADSILDGAAASHALAALSQAGGASE